MTNPVPPVDPPQPTIDPALTKQLADLTAANEAQKQEIAQLVADRDKNKTTADSTQQLLDQLAKILDPEKGKLDPDKLKSDLTERDRALADKDKELADLRLVSKVRDLAGDGANALLDSISFMTGARELDPTSKDYAKDLKTLVEKFKPKAPNKSGGADHSGGSNGNGDGQLTREDLKKMTPGEINKARVEGRLNALMGVNT